MLGLSSIMILLNFSVPKNHFSIYEFSAERTPFTHWNITSVFKLVKNLECSWAVCVSISLKWITSQQV